MSEPVLRLFSSGLLSKYGFNDGDAPDVLLDYCDDHDIDYPRWHPVLCTLVRAHLLPALDQDVTVVEIGCNHNPIRAETVDGADVTAYWYKGGGPALTPEYVEVPFAAVLQVALAAGENTRESGREA